MVVSRLYSQTTMSKTLSEPLRAYCLCKGLSLTLTAPPIHPSFMCHCTLCQRRVGKRSAQTYCNLLTLTLTCPSSHRCSIQQSFPVRPERYQVGKRHSDRPRQLPSPRNIQIHPRIRPLHRRTRFLWSRPNRVHAVRHGLRCVGAQVQCHRGSDFVVRAV